MLPEGCRPVPRGTVQVSFSHTALQLVFGSTIQRPLSASGFLPSLLYPCVQWMFALQLALAVGTFAPPALPDFIANPAPIPRPRPLLSSLSVAFAYSVCLRLADQERSGEPGCLAVTLCCSMPSETPGRDHTLVLNAPDPVACFRSQDIGLPIKNLSGLPTGFSFYRFTSQPFLLLVLIYFRIWIRAAD